ncbi:sensor histidine kinase [Alkalihalobacterium alkalinitrilicum]|uniref:sensor histidine kinase n=1 Tax=Alkalihalobacterium alkalinitrilicum TaxID=427920 RepID=UPI000995554B|nr:ATP-binding protein [Alkalihalobacterium alkalinitrilicum]
MKRSVLKQRVRVSFILLISLTVITIIMLTYFLYEKFYVEKQISLLQSHGQLVAAQYGQFSNSEFIEKINWLDSVLEANVIFTSDPMLLSGGLPFEMEIEETLITFEERQVLLEGDTLVLIREHPRFAQDILAVVTPIMGSQGLEAVLFLYMPLVTVYEPFESIRYILIGFVVLTVMVVSFVTRKITNYFIRPIEEMMEITKKMANGDLTERLEINRRDELGQLAISFNRMSSSLEQAETKRREFLSNVSHELRTPISYMQGYTEAFEEKMITPEKYMQTMKKETAYIGRLVHDLLDLAQLEGDTYPITKVPLPFAQLIEEVVEKFEWSIKNKKLTIRKELDEEIIVEGDEDRLAQVISNVLTNAIRYSNEHGNLSIRLDAHDNEAVLIFRDEGIGIPKDDVDKITERFYRVNKGRTRKDGGTGLGLAIVHQIVKLHGGKIEIQSELRQGTTVSVFLPIYPV